MLSATFVLMSVMFSVNALLRTSFVKLQSSDLDSVDSNMLSNLDTVGSTIECSCMCSSKSECVGFYFNEADGSCWGANTDQTAANAVSFYKATSCEQPLLAGVADNQLSASSYWCEADTDNDCHAPKYARLDATGWQTGAWAPRYMDTNQWIQVDFNQERVISAIVLKGRDPPVELQVASWVTGFKVMVSTDCVNWRSIPDEVGNPKVFTGTTGPDVIVIRNVPEHVVARCVRINPVSWEYYIGLRFDVLGCSA